MIPVVLLASNGGNIMNYGIKPVLGHRWRKKLAKTLSVRPMWFKKAPGIGVCGGVGVMPASVSAGSAVRAADEVAASVFGGCGKVVSVLFSGRSNSGGPYGMDGRVWLACLEAAPVSEDEKPVRLDVFITEGSVLDRDMPKGRFPRRPADPVGTPDTARCAENGATEAMAENLEWSVRERTEAIARQIAKHGRDYKIVHSRQR